MNHTACVGVVLLYGTLRLECDGIGTLYFILFSRLRVSLKMRITPYAGGFGYYYDYIEKLYNFIILIMTTIRIVIVILYSVFNLLRRMAITFTACRV